MPSTRSPRRAVPARPLDGGSSSRPARASVSPLRAWQVRALAALDGWSSGPFLLSAAPGAGKTRPAIELARRLLAAGTVSRVVVVCPTTPLTRQWAAAAGRLGLQLAPDAASPRPPRDFHGVSVTYARVASAGLRWAKDVDARTLVIADEAHHLGEDLAWGNGFAAALGGAERWLLLSGTPFRSDAAAIPGVAYDANGVAEPDVAYTYAEAVRDGICRPVAFVTFDGELSWRSGSDVIESSSFDTVLPAREAARRYRTAISTDLPDGLPRILREADARLRELRAGDHRDAGGLVIAADGAHARALALLLKEATGRAPVIVLHTETRAAERLAAFTESREPWIVAVNMVSEGVDIPRLRVGVYATAAKTALVFRQIVGRFVRVVPGRPTERSWLYLPADPILRRHAAEVEQELVPILRRRTDDEEGEGMEPRLDVLPREASEPLDFVPLSADVAPQMTLFGPPDPAPPAPLSIRPATPEPPPADPQVASGAAAFERRARLRERRQRLVGEVSRAERSSHREINAWLNGKVGVSRVEEASLEQLERSVELLVRRLTVRR